MSLTDLYQRHNSCLFVAFQSLIQQLLAQSVARVAFWSEQIKLAVGSSGQALIDVLPTLKLLIGPQPPLPLANAVEAQNRFDRTFVAFVAVFARLEHPLVIFIVSQTNIMNPCFCC